MKTPDEIWADAQIDKSYLAQHGANAKALTDLFLNYGDSSSLYAKDPTTGKSLADQYGITTAATSSAAGNPYSVQAQLGKLLSGDQYGITNNANAHGALYSGAHFAQQQHELQNAGQRNYNAYQTLAGQIGGVTGNDTNALTGAFGRLSDQALNTPVPQPAPAVVPDAGVAYQPPAAPAVLPTPDQIPGATPATANWNDNPSGYNPLAPQNNPVIKMPKLPTIKSPVGIHAQ